MAILKLDHFVQPGQDMEKSQYLILARMARIREDFSRNRLYPHLHDLEHLLKQLRDLLHHSRQIREAAIPRRIRSIDLKNQTITYEPLPSNFEGAFFLEDLITWALPRLEALLEEGRAIEAFVEETLEVEEVGIVPTYRDEGYFLIPELDRRLLHIFSYQLSLFTEQGRTLHARELKTLRINRIMLSPNSIKLELVRERRDLPNPATFLLESDLDFPFESTLLPVAKKKLTRHLLSDV